MYEVDGSFFDMEQEDILSIQANRPPFLWLSRVREVHPMKEAVGELDLPRDHWIFEPHFPGDPSLPAVIQLEAMMQLSAMCVLLSGNRRSKVMYAVRVDNARFRLKVQPQPFVIVRASMTGWRNGLGSFKTQIFSDQREAAAATVVLVSPDEIQSPNSQ